MVLPDLVMGDINHTAVSISRAKLLPSGLVMELKKAGLYGDIIAACGMAAVESHRNGLDLRETRNAANRAIYACLRGLGYIRERGSSTYTFREDACDPLEMGYIHSATERGKPQAPKAT